MDDRMTARAVADTRREKQSRIDHLRRIVQSVIDKCQTTLVAYCREGICHSFGPQVVENLSGDFVCSIVVYAEQNSAELRDALHDLSLEVALHLPDHLEHEIDVRRCIEPKPRRAE